MLIKGIMTMGVECVAPDDSLVKAAEKMRDLDVGVLPVCGKADRLVGMITDRDMIVRAIAQGYDPGTTAVRDVMTPEVIFCFEDQDVQEAVELMKDRQIRRLLVLNDDKRLVGIVSLGDLAVDLRDDQMVGNALEAISEPPSSFSPSP